METWGVTYEMDDLTHQGNKPQRDGVYLKILNSTDQFKPDMFQSNPRQNLGD